MKIEYTTSVTRKRAIGVMLCLSFFSTAIFASEGHEAESRRMQKKIIERGYDVPIEDVPATRLVYTDPAPVKKKPGRRIRIGIYADKGVGYPGIEMQYAQKLEATIRGTDPYCAITLVTAKTIIDHDALDKLDVVIFPGGSARGQSESLGEEGRERVVDFVKNGGGFVGICAGAYLAQMHDETFKWRTLKLVRARVYKDTQNWDRGQALIKVKMTPDGYRLFPELKNRSMVTMYFANGPLLVPYAPEDRNKSYTELMTFVSDVHHARPAGKGESPGKTLMLRAAFGNGRVFLVSGHAEITPGLRWMVSRVARSAAKKLLIYYPRRFVQPAKLNREIMYDTGFKKRESKLLKTFKTSLEDDDGARWKMVGSVKKLMRMGSIDLTDYLNGLLAKKSAVVRKTAAEAIVYYDNFYSLAALQKARHAEKNRIVKKSLTRAIDYLTISRAELRAAVPRKKSTAAVRKKSPGIKGKKS